MKLTKNVLIYALFFWSCQSSNKNTKAEGFVSEENREVSNTATTTSFESWFENPQPLISAHRGGPYPGFPENAIETFQYIADQIPKVVIECDVSMTKDGVLILMHDKTLDRTTTGAGNVSEKSYAELQDLSLVDNEGNTSAYAIPTLDETLIWGKDKVLFMLDVKRGVPFEKVIATIKKTDAASYAAIITYRIQDAKLVHSLNAGIIISVSARDNGAIKQIMGSNIPSKNLLGFVGTSQPEKSHYEKLQRLGIKTILGTLGNLDKSAVAKGDDRVYLNYIKNGANIIATDRPLEVANVFGN